MIRYYWKKKKRGFSRHLRDEKVPVLLAESDMMCFLHQVLYIKLSTVCCDYLYVEIIHESDGREIII